MIGKKELEKGLLCATTISLNLQGERVSNLLGYGARWNFETLNLEWITQLTSPFRRVEIPCILGAAYAFSRNYWLELKGLEGLASYGLDEQFICLKNWLLGGKSYVMTDVEFGHKFRDNETVPYKLSSPDFLQNIVLVIELFFSIEWKVKAFNYLLSCIDIEEFGLILKSLELSKQRLLATKSFFYKHQVCKFCDLVEFNKNF